MASWKDISPTAAQISVLGTAFKGIHDPYNFSRYLMMGGGGVLVCDDVTVAVPTWTFYSTTTTAAPTWVQTFDFTDSDNGWTISVPPDVGGGAVGVYTGGTGFQSVTRDANSHEIDIGITFTASTLTSATITYNRAAPGNSIDEGWRTVSSISTVIFSQSSNNSGTGLTISVNVNHNADGFYVALNTGTVNTTTTITRITLRGNGANPFGGSTGNGASPFADFTGTIAARGRFYWLSGDGTAIYVGRTTNYFQSISYSGSIAPY